ncbi:MAG: formyltransferase family protein, partial [Pseudomonadota bacterium]
MAPDPALATQFMLKATCPARSGIVAGVTSFLSDRGCYLSELAQYDDPDTRRFFMRTVGRIDNPDITLPEIRGQFHDVAAKFDMQWQLNEATRPVRVLLMVSKFDHCLTDLLYRRRKGELNMDVTAIVSNHPDAEAIATREGVRFEHLPVTKENKTEQEAALMRIIEETDTELVVLARYMQILSNDLCQKLEGRA